MKKEEKKNFGGARAAILAGLLLLTSFQNCSPGFRVGGVTDVAPVSSSEPEIPEAGISQASSSPEHAETACQITNTACDGYPQGGYVGSFHDSYDSANVNPERCMVRAADFSRFCLMTKSQSSTASYFVNKRIVQQRTVYGEAQSQSPSPTPSTAGPKQRCEEGWVLVPGDPDLGTQDFCIMKFEAQNSAQSAFSYSEQAGEPRVVPSAAFAAGTPLSSFSRAGDQRTPWVIITQKEALAACGRIGAHLTTMAEAQTISRNLLLQPLNWQSGQVGNGCMFGGHLDLDPTTPLGAPAGEALVENHYHETNDSLTSVPDKDLGKCFTRSRIINGTFQVRKNGTLSRRSLALSTNQFIWDWSGNVSEWISMSCSNNGLAEGAESVFTGASNGYGFFDYAPIDHATSSEEGRGSPIYTEWTRHYLADFEGWIFGPRNPKVPGTELLDSSNGVGMYQGCRVNGNAIYRGGAAYHGYEGGIFQTHMDHTVHFNHSYIGFRCVKAPIY